LAISASDPVQSVLEAAMRGAEMNQTLLTSDLANANTPNFEPSSVNFQDQLASALNAGTPAGNVSFQATTAPQANNPNGNGVNPDETSAQLSENGLLYDAFAEVLSAHDQSLQFAMGIGV
jgi:flagellar basal-body rod protein FlgB